MNLVRAITLAAGLLMCGSHAFGQSVAGLYNAILYHDGSEFYQHGKITLRTVNVGGELRISANVRVYFGDWDSNEYLTYEFDQVPMNLVTRQLNIRNEINDVSLTGFLSSDRIEGEWFSTIVGRVGHFEAIKDDFPVVASDSVLVTTVSGHYRGELTNTNPQSNLPERVTFSFVTTQSMTPDGEPFIHVSGTTRFYLGDFGSLEYVETPFTDVQFNFYNRFLTAKTRDYGLTFKGYLLHDGSFDGKIFSDGLGEVGEVAMNRYDGVSS